MFIYILPLMQTLKKNQMSSNMSGGNFQVRFWGSQVVKYDLHVIFFSESI